MPRKILQLAFISLPLLSGPSVWAGENISIDQSRFDDGASFSTLEDWRGAYAGFSLGIIGGGAEINKGPNIGKFEEGEGRAGIGGHVGYNFTPFGGDANGAWMLGSEVDFSTIGVDTRKSDPVLGNVDIKGSFVGSARLRVGYAWDKVYLYSTAGLAASDFSVKPANQKDTDISAGVAIGIGVEVALRDNWRGRIEAISYDFGEIDRTFSGSKRKVETDLSTIRFAISRKF